MASAPLTLKSDTLSDLAPWSAGYGLSGCTAGRRERCARSGMRIMSRTTERSAMSNADCVGLGVFATEPAAADAVTAALSTLNREAERRP
jgi:hypothetical protein